MSFITSLPLLQIHIVAVMSTLIVVTIADLHGLLWILGKKQTVPHTRMHFFHYAVWTGLSVIILSGFFMFSSYSAYLLSLTAFKLKMVFVAFLLLNAVFIGKHLTVATMKPFQTLPKKEKMLLLISGGVSTMGWIGALICAQFI